MNTLSLLIYAAGIAGTVSNLLASLIAFFIIATIAFTIFGSYFTLTKTFDVNYMTHSLIKYPEIEEKYREYGKNLLKYAKISFVLIWIFSILQVIIPNRQTVILIAASEIGERMVTNDKVANVVDPSFELLTTWVKKQTEELNKNITK